MTSRLPARFATEAGCTLVGSGLKGEAYREAEAAAWTYLQPERQELAPAPSATIPRLYDCLYHEWFLLKAILAEDGKTIQPRRIGTTRSPYLPSGKYTHSRVTTDLDLGAWVTGLRLQLVGQAWGLRTGRGRGGGVEPEHGGKPEAGSATGRSQEANCCLSLASSTARLSACSRSCSARLSARSARARSYSRPCSARSKHSLASNITRLHFSSFSTITRSISAQLLIPPS